MNKFSITNLKTLTGEENVAFECTLCAKKKAIAQVYNPGTGGDNIYTWKNPLVEKEFEKEVTDELVWELVNNKIGSREIPDSVFEHRKADEEELRFWCSEIAKKLGEGWIIGKETGGTTSIKHNEGWDFELFIASGMDYKDHTHELHILMGSPIKKVTFTKEEKKEWKIPQFDLRTCTASEIVAVLESKINWLRSILPKLQKRKVREQESLERIQKAGKELAEALGLPFQENTSYENSFSIKKKEKERVCGESFSISVNGHCCDNKSSLFLSADHISEEKLLKLIELCKQIEI